MKNLLWVSTMDSEKESLDIRGELQDLFGQTHFILVPDATGIDIIASLETRNPLRTGMKVIDQELPRGVDNRQIIEIRGKSSSGKVCYC